MNQKQAEQFIQDVMSMWEQGQEKFLDKFYYPTVIGHYQKEDFGFNEIKNRMHYINKRYPHRKFYVDEIILIDPQTVITRVRQTGMDTVYKKPYMTNVIAVYKIENFRIKEVWLITDSNLDYYAKSEEVNINPPKEKVTVEDAEKKLFMDKMIDYRYFFKGKEAKLTPRENECLYYFLEGYSSKEIAKILGITFRTAQDHIAKIKNKYHCSTKQELRQKIFPA